MRALLRAHDWSQTSLGEPDTWPVALSTAVDMILNSAFPMFVAWGADLAFLYNDAYVPILGDKHPGALGRPFQGVWTEIWDDLVPIVDRALSGKSAYFEDLPLNMVRRGYPEQTWFTFSYAPLHDDAHGVAGMYCTCIETTDRVLFERRQAFQLKVSDLLRPLTSPEDVVATTSALIGEELGLARVLYAEVDPVRDAFFVRRDWVRASFLSLSGGVFQLDDFGPAVGAALRAGQVVTVTDTALDPGADGFREIYLATAIRSYAAVPLVKAGRLVAFLGLNRDQPHEWSEDEVLLAQDIAERTWSAAESARAQAELREERDRSRYIFDTIAEGFALFDRDWTVLQMNAEGLRICCRSAEQVIGRNHWQAFPEAVGSQTERMYRQVMQTGVAGTAEYCQYLPGGDELWSDVRAYPTRDGGVATFFRDITDRKLADARLKAADQRKDEFLAMLAHELRNPLAPISAAAELLKIGRLDRAQVRQSSAVIARQVRHMTSLVDDLLDVSRVTRGLVSLSKAPVDARSIVEEAVEQVRPLIEARRQFLTLEMADQPVTVLGDKARLVQVMANLLGNAAKYTPDCRNIEVRAAREGEQLVLTVRDEGIGMEPELRSRVFDLFAQAERSSDRSQGGLGLGLALVKHLVELHGGAVACSSAGAGRGSTFVVTLPVMRVQPLAESAQLAPSEAPQGARLKLMVVDDNVDAADTLGMLLEACGHDVMVEHGALRALERARIDLPDVCLLDIGLPDMDGNELARQLRGQAATAGIVLIAVTGYGQQQERDDAFAAGFSHHLVKPIDLDQLTDILAAITSVHAARARQQETSLVCDLSNGATRLHSVP